MSTQLQHAEQELYEWATGARSYINEQLSAESSVENRGQTLVQIAQRDAAEIELAINRVRALRLLEEVIATLWPEPETRPASARRCHRCGLIYTSGLHDFDCPEWDADVTPRKAGEQ